MTVAMQIFLYLFFINNLFITSSLIIGSGAVIHALTGGLLAPPLTTTCCLFPHTW